MIFYFVLHARAPRFHWFYHYNLVLLHNIDINVTKNVKPKRKKDVSPPSGNSIFVRLPCRKESYFSRVRTLICNVCLTVGYLGVVSFFFNNQFLRLLGVAYG